MAGTLLRPAPGKSTTSRGSRTWPEAAEASNASSSRLACDCTLSRSTQHDFPLADPPHLEHVARQRLVPAFAWIGGRKQFIARPTRGLEPPPPADREVADGRFGEFGKLHEKTLSLQGGRSGGTSLKQEHL